jgi:hypothetical protein
VVTETIAITVNPLPVVAISPSSSAVCFNNTVSFSASGASTYSWSTGDQTSTTTLTALANTLVAVSGTDAAGCVNTETAALTVNPLPVVAISPASPTACAGSVVTLTASGASSYSWSAGSQTSVQTLTASSTVTLTATGTDTFGCVNSATAILAVSPLPTISISQPAASVCVNSPVSFTASGATSYQWTSGPANAVLTVTPNASATYTVTGSFTTGCASTATAGIFTFPLPVIGASPSTATICAGESIELVASGGTGYVWLPGNATTTGVAVSPAASVVYTVTGTDANNCSSTASASITVDPCTGIAAMSGQGVISLYPNPSGGLITADMPFAGEKRLTVLNAAGAVVQVISTSEERISIDLSQMAKGIYFVRVSGVQSSNFRIIVQ